MHASDIMQATHVVRGFLIVLLFVWGFFLLEF